MLSTLEWEFLEHVREHRNLPTVTYAGAAAGTGVGGVGGAGPIGVGPNGQVTTGNRSGRQTFPDGSTLEVTIQADGTKIVTLRDFITGFETTYTEIPGVQKKWEVFYLNGEPKETWTIDYYSNRTIVTLDDHVMGVTIQDEYTNGVLLSRVESTDQVDIRTNYIGPGTIERETSIEGEYGRSELYEYRYTNESFEVGTWYSHSIDRIQSVDNTIEYMERTSTAIIYNGRPALEIFTINRVERPGTVPDASSTREVIYFDDRQPVKTPVLPPNWDAGSFKTMSEALIDGGGPQKHGMISLVSAEGTFSVAAHVGTKDQDHLAGAGFLYGGIGDDTLVAGDASDTLFGGEGRDVLVGGRGPDTLNGGEGVDFASYAEASNRVVVSLLDGLKNSGDAAADTYESIEGLIGSRYNDCLKGNAENNTLFGGSGQDELAGDRGGDILHGGLGADTLDGGFGFDLVSYERSEAGVIVSLALPSQNTGEAAGDVYISIAGVIGSAFADTIIGNSLSNRLVGDDGDDILVGNGGGDAFEGGNGKDYLYSSADAEKFDGGSDHDTVSYFNSDRGVQVYLWDISRNMGAAWGDLYLGIEVIDGTRFNDILEGADASADVFWGDAGNDRMKGLAGADTLSGGDGDDKLEGGTGADRLDGGNGRDTASYYGAVVGVGVYLHNTALNTGDAAGDTYASIEVIDGSTHSDKLEGNAAANTFWGDAGHDALKGFGGADSLSGGDGEDQLSGGEGADLLDGGAGYDFAVYADAASGVLVDLMNTLRNTGEAYGDAYASIEGLIGSAHADQFYGTAGSDDFHGGGGDDRLEGRGGADQLVGGEGRDHAVYWGASSGVIANLTAGVGTAGDAAGDRFYGIEGLEGSHHADTLTGDGGANTLYGLGGNDLLLGEGDIYTHGNDYIEGGDGADTISGGGGSDWLLGNAGRDVFRFDTRLNTAGLDTLADFSAAEDRIALETSVFGFAPQFGTTGNTPSGTLSSGAFKLGTSATASAQRIVYDQASGAIYFDADGVGGQAQVQFAKVAAGTALTASHFQLFTL